MSQINTNVPSMLAQRVLGNQNRALTTSLERLSTGFRINRGADDPAGLIASETLRSEKTALAAAMKNIQRAEHVVNTAEGGLQEINNLLLELQSLVGESGNDSGLSAEEKAANQTQIDSILRTIDRIADSTSFNGQSLLNGDMDYKVDLSNADGISGVNVNMANAPTGGLDVDVTLLSESAVGTVVLNTNEFGEDDSDDFQNITITVEGSLGSVDIEFTSEPANIGEIIDAINAETENTGVVAEQIGSSDFIRLDSTESGSDAFARAAASSTDSEVETDIIGELNEAGDGIAAGTATDDLRVDGTDLEVNIDGQAAIINGMTARLVTSNMDLTVTLVESGESGAMSVGETESFTITGGANFNITPRVSLAGRASIGIGTVHTSSLGDGSGSGSFAALMTGGTANVESGDVAAAQDIIDDAINQVSSLRGRLGAFQKDTLQATMNNLGVTLENTAAAESVIRETDFAEETATLTRQQILSQAAMQSLAIANAQPQAVLSLLG